MGAFAGVPQVTAALKRATAAAEEMDVAMLKAGHAVEKTLDTTEGFIGALTTLMDIQTEINDGYKAQAAATGGNNADYNNYVADKLAKLEADIIALNPNSGLAAQFDPQIQQLRAGVLSPMQVIANLQGLLSPFIPGLMKEIADASSTPELRKEAEELLRFLMGGSLNV